MDITKKNGITEQSDFIKQSKKLISLRYINYFSGCLFVVFAMLYLDEVSSPLRSVVLTCAFAAVLNCLFVSYSTSAKWVGRSTFAITLLFTLGIVYSGGYLGSGLFWAYLLPPIAFIALGNKEGGSACVISLLILAVMLAGNILNINYYTDPQVSRFLIVFFCLSVVLFIKDYNHETGFKSMSIINEQEQKLANTDPLTNLPNRRFLDSEYFEWIQRAPDDFFPMTIAYGDLDKFKSVNDTLGHEEGDSVLRSVSALCKESLRSTDVFARTGGEEFLVMLPKTKLVNGYRVIESLRNKIANSSDGISGIGSIRDRLSKHNLSITMSFGVAQIDRYESLRSSLKAADQAMYQAKHEGRNKTVIAKGEEFTPPKRIAA